MTAKRKRKPKTEVRSKSYTLRLNQREVSALKKRLKECNCYNVGEFMRRVVLKDAIEEGAA